MKKIYLAGPDVFRHDALAHGRQLVNILKSRGYIGLFPLDNLIPEAQDPAETARSIFQANRQMIDDADAVLANLSPFRGPSADCGTVWECGYAHAQKKPVIGYRSALTRTYKDAVLSQQGQDELLVEDFGLWDNLMLVYGIDQVSSSLEEALGHLADLVLPSKS
ncbi:MAG: nucleoside 2-deoxyribosyltransferase [Polyangiaceae bacterium]|nr:nucleoside 2-deoxyribosyltransferase [Polyangiaceae bacterium]